MKDWIQKIKLKIKQYFCRHNATETVEQVSVDNIINLLRNYVQELWHLSPERDLAVAYLEELSDRFNRLMRLDENVKRTIAELKYRKLGEVNQLAWEQAIELLESLYDDAIK
jgi:hypothetical protein